MACFERTWAIIHKESLHMMRDPRTLRITIMMPVLLLLLLGYTTSLDIRGIPMAIYDQSKSVESRELIESYRVTESFVLDFSAQSYDDLRRLMDSGKIQVGLIIPPEYAAEIAAGHTANVACVIDGSNPTVGTQVLAIVTMVGQSHGARIMREELGVSAAQLPGIDARMRVWYNPGLNNVNFMIPAIIGLILQMMCSSLTANSIVGERELGTMEQLNITPVRSLELIVGKATPYIVVAALIAAEILAIGVFWFGMEIHGSLILLIGFCLIFMFTALAWGLLVSVVAKTRQQAQMMNMLLLLPSQMLSGMMFPILSMPAALRYLAALMPLTYFTKMVRGVVLKGVGLDVLWMDMGALIAIGIVLMAAAVARFRKTSE
jgi:ABC-2 type transport system permease protein